MYFIKIIKNLGVLCLLFVSGLGLVIPAHASAVEDEVKQAASLYLLGSYDEAFKAFMPLAAKGNPSAQFYLAELYQADGKNLDRAQAVFWYQKAAQQGNSNAQFNLANAYYDGEGISEDLYKAANWYERAAISGVPKAQLNLGYMYSKGEGVQQSDEMATLWYKIAAQRGNKKAQSNLGYRYCQGVGVEQNLGQCAYWVKKAMDQGHENAKKIWDTFDLEQHLDETEQIIGEINSDQLLSPIPTQTDSRRTEPAPEPVDREQFLP